MRTLRNTIAAAVAALTMLTAALLGLPGASAQTLNTSHAQVYVTNSGWYVGSYKNTDGTILYCVDPGQGSPDGSFTAWTATTSWSKLYSLGNTSAAGLHQLAYLLWRYGGQGASSRNMAVIVQLLTYQALGYTSSFYDPAIGIQANVYFNVNNSGSISQAVLKEMDPSGALLATAQNIWAETVANANMGWNGTTFNKTTNLFAISDANGGYVPPGSVVTISYQFPNLGAGKTVTFHVTNPDGSVDDIPVLTDATSTATLNYTVPAGSGGAGSFTIDADMGPVAPAWPMMASPSAGRGTGPQAVAAATATPLNWDDPDAGDFESGYQPMIVTHTSHQLIQPGQQNLSDNYTVTGGMPGQPWAGTTSLYCGFPTDQAAQTADLSTLTPIAIAAISGTYDTNGEDTGYTTVSINVPLSGFCRWGEKIPGDPDLGILDAIPGPSGPETTLLTAPTVTTAASVQIAAVGAPISDTVTATGVFPAVGGAAIVWTLTGSLLGPLTPTASGCAGLDWSGAPVAQPVNQTVAGDTSGHLTLAGVGSFTPAVAGCFTYTETLTGVAPDGSSVSVTHPAGDVAQTVLVVQLGVTSQVSAKQAYLGQRFTDQVMLEGLIPDDQAVITYHGTLYGPLPYSAGYTCDNLDWAQAPVAITFDVEIDQAKISPVGTLMLDAVGGFTPTLVGCYSHGGVLTATSAADPTVVLGSYVHQVGQPPQTILVLASAGGKVDTGGRPASPGWGLWLAAGLLTAGAGAGVWLAARKRLGRAA